jgi:hypothetical protein
MPSRAKSGPVRVELDADRLLAGLREVGAEALATAVEDGQRRLQAVVDAGRPQLPVRSGTLRDSIRVLVARRGDAVEVLVTSTDAKARYKRYSRYTSAGLVELARTRAQARLDEAQAQGRATLPLTVLVGRELSRARRVHGPGAPSEALAGQQAYRAVIGTPAGRAVRSLIGELQAAVVAAAERV